jgi:hypothetical protein
LRLGSVAKYRSVEAVNMGQCKYGSCKEKNKKLNGVK